jgi:hypothetical protein
LFDRRSPDLPIALLPFRFLTEKGSAKTEILSLLKSCKIYGAPHVTGKEITCNLHVKLEMDGVFDLACTDGAGASPLQVIDNWGRQPEPLGRKSPRNQKPPKALV